MGTTQIINATGHLTTADRKSITAIIAQGGVGKGLMGRKGSPLSYSVTANGEWFEVRVVRRQTDDWGRKVTRQVKVRFQTR